MTKAVLIANGSNAITLASGEECNLIGWNNESSTEANTQISCTEGATFSNLRARITGGGSGTNNFQFRDAGANGNQLATRSGAGDCEDASNSDTLSAGDLFNIAYTDTGSNSSIAWVAANVEFASGYGCFHGCANFPGTVCDVPSATQYFSLSGLLVQDGDATIARQQFKNRAYTSWAAMQVRITANARTNTSEFKNNINGSAGTGICSFAAGVTGLVEDTGIGDSLADGDLLCHSLTLSTGVEDLTVASVVSTFKSTITKQEVISYIGGSRAASATEHFFACGGYVNDMTTYTEAQARCKVGYSGTASNLRLYVSAYTYTAAPTLTLYVNGVVQIQLNFTGTGWTEEAGETFAFDADDEISFSLVGGGTGSATIFQVGMTLAPDQAGALAGTATLTFTPVAAMGGTGALAGSSTLTITPSAALGGDGALAGSSTVEFTGSGTLEVPASEIEGTATIAFSPVATLLADGALLGSSTLTITPTGTVAGDGALVGSSTLTFTGVATILADGALLGSSVITFTPTAALTGDGALLGSSMLTFTGSATLTGAGALLGSSTLLFTPTATLLADGVLAGSSTVAFTPTATALATGVLAGSSTLTFAPTGTMVGDGALLGSSLIEFAPVGNLTGGDALAGSAVITFTPSATLVATGDLAGASTLEFTPTGTVAGSANIAGTSSIGFTGSATMLGAGDLAGSAVVSFAPLASLQGAAPIAGTVTLSFSGLAAVTGTAALAGSASIEFQPTGSMVAFGDLSGLASLSFTPAGVLLADGALAGESVLALIATGVLSDAEPPEFFDGAESVQIGARARSVILGARETSIQLVRRDPSIHTGHPSRRRR